MAWGFTYPTYLHKLASIQNKAVKVIGGGNFSECNTILCKTENTGLILLDLYKFETVKLVHDHVNSKLPFSISDHFKKPGEVSNRTTKNLVNQYNL